MAKLINLIEYVLEAECGYSKIYEPSGNNIS